MVEATVFDSAPRPNVITPLLLMSLVPAAIVSPAFFGVCLGLMLAWELRPRRRPRHTKLRCRPGVVRVPGVGSIRARDLVGATTCRHGTGVSLMLAHKRRQRRPIVIDLPSEDALLTVCRSLGIGHHGFGYVDVATRAPVGSAFRFWSALASLVLTIVVFAGGAATTELAPFLSLALLGWVVAALATLGNQPPTLRLTSGGAFLPLPFGSTFVPFRDMERVELGRQALTFQHASPNGLTAQSVLVAPSRWSAHGPSRPELEHTAEQLRAAVDRAHGNYALKEQPEALASLLARGSHERLRDWHARLDTIGVGAGGYRATRRRRPRALDAPRGSRGTRDVRGAAARILARSDPEQLRVRVADVLAAVREQHERRRIAATIDEELLAEEEEREAHKRG